MDLNDNPFYIHPNENPSAALVSAQLRGSNYTSWCRAMTMSLETKNKLQFVDGTLPRPALDDPTFRAWKRCNTMVISWIHHSIDPVIKQSILWIQDASAVWAELKERYYQGDVFRIAEIQEDLYKLKQGDATIIEYLTQLKSLWQEFENYCPIPACTCAVQCACDLIPAIKRYQERDCVIRFLKGLNDQYSAVRSQIMLMNPLPNLNQVFSMLIQQERQMHGHVNEDKIMANVTANRGRGRGFPSRPYYQNERSGAYSGRGGQYSNNSASGNKFYSGVKDNRDYNGKSPSYRGGKSYNNSPRVCSWCNRTGHTIAYCYEKHGFPPGTTNQYGGKKSQGAKQLKIK